MPSTATAATTDFNGTYRADYGPGTDLDDKPVPECACDDQHLGGPLGVWPERLRRDRGELQGNALLSNLTFDQFGGKWVAVGLARRTAAATHRPRSGSSSRWSRSPTARLVGDSVRASTDSLCAAKRTLNYPYGDADPNNVPDPAVLPPRAIISCR